LTKSLGTARNHDDLVRLLDRRRVDLQWSMAELDFNAGLGDAHFSHIASPGSKHGRNLGKVSLDALLDALGLALRVVVVEDREQGQRNAVMARNAELKAKKKAA